VTTVATRSALAKRALDPGRGEEHEAVGYCSLGGVDQREVPVAVDGAEAVAAFHPCE
jgi:hypothetical protein